MARILAIDYGEKRCGLAATDPEQIIASTIGFQFTSNLMSFLKDYFEKEPVERVVLGYPTKTDGTDTDSTPSIRRFKADFEKQFPDKPIVLHDESFSSKIREGIKTFRALSDKPSLKAAPVLKSRNPT